MKSLSGGLRLRSSSMESVRPVNVEFPWETVSKDFPEERFLTVPTRKKQYTGVLFFLVFGVTLVSKGHRSK